MKKIIVLLFIPLLLCLIWFRNGLIFGGGEEGILFSNSTQAIKLSTTVWIEYGTGLPVSGWLSRAPLMFFASSVTNFLPPFLFQALLFFIIMLVGSLSVYYLTQELLDKYNKKFLISFLAATFYLMNPFSMSQVWSRGIIPQYISFALLPLALLLFHLALKNKKYIFVAFITLSSIAFAYSFSLLTFIVVFWFVLGLYFLFTVFTELQKAKILFFGIPFLFLLFFLWIITSSWWFFPLISSSSTVYSAGLSGAEENLGTLLGVSRNFPPDMIIRLLQKTYFVDSGSSYGDIYLSFPFQLISWLPVVFLIIGLAKIRKVRELKNFWYFVLLLVIGLLVSLGSNPPLGGLFLLFFNNFPVLQAFRNPFEKFGLVYVLGYAPIFALGLTVFLEYLSKKYKVSEKTMLAYGVPVVLMLIVGIYAWPMWTGRVLTGSDDRNFVSVPEDYKNLNTFLNNNNLENYRVFMTPIVAGDGAFFKWGRTKYIGVDPMQFILDPPTISNGVKIPFYHDFIQSMRKYMPSMNTVGGLSLLRTQYLVDRKDMFMISEEEFKHEKYLTDAIYPPKGIDGSSSVVCQNRNAIGGDSSIALVLCQLTEPEGNWSGTRYLQVVLKTDVPANFEFAFRDEKGMRPRWDGRAATEYSTDGKGWNKVVIPLGAPTEVNNNTDFSKIRLVEIQAHPIGFPDASVGQIQLQGIWLDPGKEEKIQEFKKIKTLGKLDVYEPLDFNPSLEYGVLSNIEKADNFINLFELSNKKRNLLSSFGFILPSQNKGKNLGVLSATSSATISEKSRISDTRYWMKINDKEKINYIILSKTFDPEWKVLPGVSKEELNGGFFTDVKLLKRAFVSEETHFVVNGYANLWKVDDTKGLYGIVFMPQIIADIGFKISVISVILLSGLTFLLVLKKKLKP